MYLKNIIDLLIDHFIWTDSRTCSKLHNINKATSVLKIWRVCSHSNKAKAIVYDDNQDHMHSNLLSFENLEDLDTKAYLKPMLASTLRKLLKHNITMCRIIVESKALMWFITLLVEGPRYVQYLLIMVLRDITTVLE